MLRRGATVAVFAEAMAGQRGDTFRFPDDREVTDAIVEKPLCMMLGRKERLVGVLWRLEQALRTKHNAATPRPEVLNIGHVMPRAWRAHWPLPDGRLFPADGKASEADASLGAAAAHRARVLQTLGNLTLVTPSANAAASNGAFAEKRDWLRQSLLALNLPIITEPQWDEGRIEARGRTLARLAVGVWPSLGA